MIRATQLFQLCLIFGCLLVETRQRRSPSVSIQTNSVEYIFFYKLCKSAFRVSAHPVSEEVTLASDSTAPPVDGSLFQMVFWIDRSHGIWPNPVKKTESKKSLILSIAGLKKSRGSAAFSMKRRRCLWMELSLHFLHGKSARLLHFGMVFWCISVCFSGIPAWPSGLTDGYSPRRRRVAKATHRYF